jgi:hypothetical protein
MQTYMKLALSYLVSQMVHKLQYMAVNLVQLPNFSELLFGFTFRNTCSPTWNSLATLAFFA